MMRAFLPVPLALLAAACGGAEEEAAAPQPEEVPAASTPDPAADPDPDSGEPGRPAREPAEETGSPSGEAPAPPDPEAADPPPSDPKAPQDPAADPRADVARLFEEEGIDVDVEAGTVTLDAVVNAPRDPIEFLLVHRRGKTHEALFYTHSKPSVLNAALLMLGYQEGKNVSYVEADPLPTREEVELGAEWIEVFPPEGQRLWMTVRWFGEDGEQAIPVEDLLLDVTAGHEVTGARFLYLGGRMAPLYRNEPPVFVADFEGNLISTIYKLPGNHLVTIEHERARDETNWWLTARCPEPGTEVELVFHAGESDLHRARRQRIAADGPSGDPRGEAPSEGPGPASSGHRVPEPDRKGKDG